MDTENTETDSLNLYGLISRERAEKFDLLAQLILNQREAIVVCGDSGVGKTTYFETFKNIREKIGVVCLLSGAKRFNLAHIQTQLLLAIELEQPDIASQDLTAALGVMAQRQQKAVLLIDDAAKLMSGVLTALIEYMLHNPSLRIVFAFTREQLYAKSITDKALEDCYFLEIPPLNKADSAEFLAKHYPDESAKLNDKLLSTLYQRTHGIPGQIIHDFPAMFSEKPAKTLNLGKILLLGLLFLLGCSFFYFRYFNHNPQLTARLVSYSQPLSNIISAIKQKLHQAADL